MSLSVVGGFAAHVNRKVNVMSETLHIETADVYEPPVLAEAGDFAELTQGRGIRFPEGSGARFGLSH